MRAASPFNIPKDRAIQLATEVAQQHAQHVRSAELRADGGTIARSPIARLSGRSRRQLVLLGAGVLAVAARLGSS